MKNGSLSSKGLPTRHKETKLPVIMVSFNEPLEESETREPKGKKQVKFMKTDIPKAKSTQKTKNFKKLLVGPPGSKGDKRFMFETFWGIK